jgi:hypothetical protein
MLFDLRGRGRRRTVQVIYVGLALLIGGGLIFFGVGAGLGGGGLLTSLSGSEGSNSASFANQIKKYQKLVAKQPQDVSAWEGLTNAQLHEAGGETYLSNGKLTSKGTELFSRVAHSWNSYLALNPPKPNVTLAKEMVRIFGEEGLNEPAAAVQVLQLVVASEPQSASLFGALAEYAYKAKNTRQGDLAAAKAVSLAPPAQRATLKKELAELKKSGAAGSTAASTSGAASTGGSVSTSGTSGTVTIGGKTYPIQGGSSGAAGSSPSK